MVESSVPRKCNDHRASCKSRNTALAALALAVAACTPQPQEAAPTPASAPVPATPLAGGWQAADPKGEGVAQAAAYAAAHLPRGRGTLAEVVSARTQVVAGTNLAMELRMADGARWAVTVWHRLDGSYELTDAQPLP